MHATSYLEHANLQVQDIDEASHFILTALPDWRLRGQGDMDWFGKPVQWRHLGNDHAYIALQSGATEPAANWRNCSANVKHLGMVVASLPALLMRLEAAGYLPDHWGASHPHRRSVYFLNRDGIQFE
ncbi:VOC family protein, partial [Chitinimonas sp.]|uniref:VOC family protein n=1 Tax=Chitinimonas sp. TaxID=1934313 RepID=UPI0035AF0E40